MTSKKLEFITADTKDKLTQSVTQILDEDMRWSVIAITINDPDWRGVLYSVDGRGTMKPKVYLDMDGVLADFDGYMLQHGIINKTGFIHRPKSTWTPEEVELDRRVVEVMTKPGFWLNLPLMPGAKALVGYLYQEDYKPYILTARPNLPGTEWVAKEKLIWIEQYFPDLVNNFICCLRSEKAQYALEARKEETTYNILVDDMERNCEEWEEAGGIAVHHNGDWEDALDDLDTVLHRWPE